MEELITYDKENDGDLYKAGSVKAYIAMNKNTCEMLLDTISKYLPALELENKLKLEAEREKRSQAAEKDIKEVKAKNEADQTLLF